MVKITVVGSASIDLTVQAHKWPQKGETILGDSLHISFGGKGANQAVAAARLGAQVTLIACLGQDNYAHDILKNLKDNNVNTEYINKLVNETTGTAHITLVDGDNSIIVVGGANSKLSTTVIDNVKSVIGNSDIVMVQQEIPIDTIIYLINLCSTLKVPLLLNPAPIQDIPQDILEKASYITPNEHEIIELFPNQSVDAILTRYANKLIVTQGENGARYNDGKIIKQIPTFSVPVVDTTGAGDTFNAGLAVAIAQKQPLVNCIRFANAAAALSVQKLGAQGGMPKLEDVKLLLKTMK